MFFFFFKQKTAYELRISDWSSDVCSSDLRGILRRHGVQCLSSGHRVDLPPAPYPLGSFAPGGDECRRDGDTDVKREFIHNTLGARLAPGVPGCTNEA